MFVQVEVEVVDDGELPSGVKRVLVERPHREPLLLVAQSASGTLQLLTEREQRLRAV